MPRVYKKVVGGRAVNTSRPEILSEAVKTVKLRGWSIRRTAEYFNVKRSTLSDRVRGLHSKKQGGQTSLPEDVENMLVRRLILCANWGFPMTLFDLRVIVKSYLDRRGLNMKRFKNNLPGIDWSKSFMARHKHHLSERLSQNIKLARAEVGPETVNNYFENLKKVLADVPASNVVNYDETNLTDDPGRKKVVVKRGTRYPERVQNSSKSSTSLMLAAAGDGNVLPCYVVYKAKHLYDTWTTGGPEKCRYNRSKSGWFDNICFEDWFINVVVPYMRRLDGKKVLIGDNLSSHISLHVIEKCEELDISFVFLPPNSTHLTQPLDVAFFRPMKIYWRQILDKWRMTGEGRNCPSVPKDIFPRLLRQLSDKLKSTQEGNVKSGFEKCGIIPLNPDPVLNRVPQKQNTPVDNLQETVGHVDASFIELLQEMRGLDEVHTRKRAKRLKVDPGKSVSKEDFEMEKRTDKGIDKQQTSKSVPVHDDNSSSDEQSENTESSESSESEMSAEDEVPVKESTVSDHKRQNIGTANSTVRRIKRIRTCRNSSQFTGIAPVNEFSELQEGQWIAVQYSGKIRTLFLAKIECLYTDDNDLEVCFLQRKGMNSNTFILPVKEDKALIDFDQIVGVLKAPLELRRGYLRFDVDANEWTQ